MSASSPPSPQSSEISSRAWARPYDPMSALSGLRSSCRTASLFSYPCSKALVSPNSFLGLVSMTWAVPQAPTLGLMTYCGYSEILTNFWTRTVIFILHWAWELWCWSWLGLSMYISNPSNLYPDLSGVPWSEAWVTEWERRGGGRTSRLECYHSTIFDVVLSGVTQHLLCWKHHFL